jgi:transposase
MRVDYQQVIKEDPEELKQIQMEQKDVSNFKKIQGLYLLKMSRVKTASSLADYLGVHRVTVQRWLKSYRDGGLSSLLALKPKSGRSKAIGEDAIAGLKARLSEEEKGFNNYGEIQSWLEENYQIKVKYHTVYHCVRYKLKAKLKVPRRSAAKKNEAEAERFKKNCQNC